MGLTPEGGLEELCDGENGTCPPWGHSAGTEARRLAGLDRPGGHVNCRHHCGSRLVGSGSFLSRNQGT